MNREFCVEDTVRCVDGAGISRDWPKKGEIYAVRYACPGFIGIMGDEEPAWSADRFELVTEARHTTPIASPEAPRTTLPADSAERKNVPLWRGLLRYFPAALAGVARISKAGNDKHNPGEEMHHARSKSTDQADCILRHLVDMSEDFGRGVGRDTDGTPFVDQIAWRALALAQIWHEEHDNAPMAPGAQP